MSPVVSDPAATAGLSPRDPAETHGAACPAPGGGCRQLHCAVCTAHLPNPNQRFCSPRCRSRARSLRKRRLSCPHCGAELWLPKPRARLPCGPKRRSSGRRAATPDKAASPTVHDPP